MRTSLVDLLSNVDTMILGGIVGSAVLAFVLVVIIFSLRIKVLHDQNRHVHQLLEEQQRDAQRLQEALDAKVEHITETEAAMEGFQRRQEALEKAITALRDQNKAVRASVEASQEQMHALTAEKKRLEDLLEAVEGERDEAREEKEAILKRNEFWVTQLSELRTKHDALKLKLRMLPRSQA